MEIRINPQAERAQPAPGAGPLMALNRHALRSRCRSRAVPLTPMLGAAAEMTLERAREMSRIVESHRIGDLRNGLVTLAGVGQERSGKRQPTAPDMGADGFTHRRPEQRIQTTAADALRGGDRTGRESRLEQR
jgi:hypothetical protein